MNRALLLVILPAVLGLTGGHSAKAAPDAAAFAAAAKEVASVKEVVVPGSDVLAKAVSGLGGYPPNTDVSTSKKAADAQYSVGYDAKGNAVVAVALDKEGTVTVITDADLIKGYVAKVRSLTGEKTSSSTASSTVSSGPGGGSSTGNAPKKKGVFYVGMTKAEAAAKVSALGSCAKFHEGTDHEIWKVRPIQGGDVANEVSDRAVGAVGGIFGGAASFVKPRAHAKNYTVTFTGDVVSDVDVSDL